MYKYIKRILI